MGENEVDRGVDLIYRYCLGGRNTANQIKAPWLKYHLEQVSRSCREVFGGICARCPDCPCAARALVLASTDVEPPLVGPVRLTKPYRPRPMLLSHRPAPVIHGPILVSHKQSPASQDAVPLQPPAHSPAAPLRTVLAKVIPLRGVPWRRTAIRKRVVEVREPATKA